MENKRQDLIEKMFKEMLYAFRVMRPHKEGLREKLGHWRDHKMSHSHLDLLFRLGKEENGISVKDIAENLHITPGAVTQMVDGLVSIGLIIREEDPNDRRSQRVKLSPKARDKADWFRKHFIERVEPRFSNLSDEEVVQLTNLLAKINKSQ